MKPLIVLLAVAIVVLCAIGFHTDGRIESLEKRVAELEPVEPTEFATGDPPPVQPPEGAIGIPSGVFEVGTSCDGTVLYKSEFMIYPEQEAKQ